MFLLWGGMDLSDFAWGVCCVDCAMGWQGLSIALVGSMIVEASAHLVRHWFIQHGGVCATYILGVSGISLDHLAGCLGVFDVAFAALTVGWLIFLLRSFGVNAYRISLPI